MKIYAFDQLSNCDLIIDAIYEGGNSGNLKDDPINKLLSVRNQGGFRFAGKAPNYKYVVLYTSGNDIDWPDNIDTETGIFQYYGDNKKPGQDLHKTSGNLFLKILFDSLHSENDQRVNVPPIFVFRKFETNKSKRSVQFLGLCVPGVLKKNSINDLVAIWRTAGGQRFQNYRAFFTILNIPKITRPFINSLDSKTESTKNYPIAFKKWKDTGKYEALTSEKTVEIRNDGEQLPDSTYKWKLLNEIFQFFKPYPILFESFATDIYCMSDSRAVRDEITKPSRDGGRDAIGRLKLGLDNDPIFAEFALEAKCYNPGKNKNDRVTVGVRGVARLISRIRNRQFGILVTTSIVGKQAYEEVREDKHPIILISGGDIIEILIKNGFGESSKLNELLNKYKS
jgi:hypothetical protein